MRLRVVHIEAVMPDADYSDEVYRWRSSPWTIECADTGRLPWAEHEIPGEMRVLRWWTYEAAQEMVATGVKTGTGVRIFWARCREDAILMQVLS